MTRSPRRRNHPSPMGPSQKHVFPQKFTKAGNESSFLGRVVTKFPLLQIRENFSPQ